MEKLTCGFVGFARSWLVSQYSVRRTYVLTTLCILGSGGEIVCIHEAACVRMDGLIVCVYIEE